MTSLKTGEGCEERAQPFRMRVLPSWRAGCQDMSDGRAGDQPPLNQSTWQLSAYMKLSLSQRCLLSFVEVEDITKDSTQKDENRLGKVCLSMNKPWKERVIFLLLCKLLAGCSSFAFQINCASFSPDNAFGAKVHCDSNTKQRCITVCVEITQSTNCRKPLVT